MISIILPVYNCEKYLLDSIQSMLNQDYEDFELIIINDGSTDSSEEIILSFRDNRIKYYANEFNKGLVFSLNKAVKIANGEFIARMDADDIACSNRLKLQLKFLLKNPTYGVCGSFVKVINEQGISGETIILPIRDREIKTYLYFSSPFIHPSVLVRTSILKENSYSIDFNTAEDFELWIRLSLKTKFYNIPKALINYRIHKENISKVNIIKSQESVTKLLRSMIIPQLRNKSLIDNYIRFVLRDNRVSIYDYELWLSEFIKEPLFDISFFSSYFIKRWFGLCLSHKKYKLLLINQLSKKMPIGYYLLMIKYIFQCLQYGIPRSIK